MAILGDLGNVGTLRRKKKTTKVVTKSEEDYSRQPFRWGVTQLMSPPSLLVFDSIFLSTGPPKFVLI